MISARMLSSTTTCTKRMMTMRPTTSRPSPSTTALTTARHGSRHPSHRCNTTKAQQTTTPKQPKKTAIEDMDPHVMASEFIAKSNTHDRTQGTVALQAYLTTEQKIKNFALAGTLMGFVTWVWWYSINAVGKTDFGTDASDGKEGDGDGSLANLRAEAQEARERKERKRSVSEEEAAELVELDIGISEKDLLGDDIVLAVAAPDEVARYEEERNQKILNKGSSSNRRPLWKKVVFFWKKE